MKTKRAKKKKLRYHMPVITPINLAAEEVLGAGCKLSILSTAFGSPVNCVLNNCSMPGS